MQKKIDWDAQIGRRLQLRQLHVFLVVVQHRSLAMAARALGVATPTVSEIIADLEHVLGVRLFERNSKGVEPTRYGQALRRRTLIVFDELRQSVEDIKLLADPTVGEVRIACPLGIAYSIVPPIFERFVSENPNVVVHFDEVIASSTTRDLQALRDRRYDLIMARGGDSVDGTSTDDLDIQSLLNDRLVVVAGPESKWARRRKIDLAELAGEAWIMQSAETGNYRILARAFETRGLPIPKANLVTVSISVIAYFLERGAFLTAIPRSVAHFTSLKVLPVDLSSPPWPINVVTIKRRILSPVAARFIACAREVTRPLRERPDRAFDDPSADPAMSIKGAGMTASS
jgi:DNA-binding transcriptional LysR family regulator